MGRESTRGRERNVNRVTERRRHIQSERAPEREGGERKRERERERE